MTDKGSPHLGHGGKGAGTGGPLRHWYSDIIVDGVYYHTYM